MAAKVDAAIKSGEVETGPIESKERLSQLDVRKTDHDLGYNLVYGSMRQWMQDVGTKDGKNRWKHVPAHNNPNRDFFLATVWQDEPILAGAIYSMTAKMAALGWTVTGKRLHATNTARMLSRAAHMGGWDWGGFISSVSNDFYTVNRGTFIETAKDGDPTFAPMVDIGHMDALCCSLTGNSLSPVMYSSMETGQILRFKPGEFIHFASLPSPREYDLGAGICAVDRAFRAAQLLMGLHDYDDQKLDNLPPEGVAAVSGLTMDEFQDALKLWHASREAGNSLTFPQVLWLIGSDPSAKVSLDMIGFASLPESFDRKSVVEQYVNTIALCFGVDAREFWSMAGGGLGSAGESEIQHLKAKGKGPGEFISTMERHINGELYDDTDFAFDTQDIEEDANAAAIAKAWIDAFFPLYNLPPKQEDTMGANPKAANPKYTYSDSSAFGSTNAVTKARGNPSPDKPNGQPTLPTPMLPGVQTGGAMSLGAGSAGGLGNSFAGQSGAANSAKYRAEQVITKDEFLRILADRGVIPDYLVTDERIVVTDTEVHNDSFKERYPDDLAKFEWHNGICKEVRVSLGSMWTGQPVIVAQLQPSTNIQDAIIIKEQSLEYDSVKDALDFLREKEQQIVAEARNIHGDPIPDGEAVRGSSPTRKTLHDELERWRNNPILSKYALTVEEEIKKFGILK
jgi:hypothetical protein